jgi:hypothetical protein
VRNDDEIGQDDCSTLFLQSRVTFFPFFSDVRWFRVQSNGNENSRLRLRVIWCALCF